MVLGPIDNWSMDRRKKVGRSFFIAGTIFIWAINAPSVTIGSTVYNALLIVGGMLCLIGTSVIVLRPGRVFGSTDEALGGGHD